MDQRCSSTRIAMQRLEPLTLVSVLMLTMIWSNSPFPSSSTETRRCMMVDYTVMVEFARDVVDNERHNKLRDMLAYVVDLVCWEQT